MEDLKVRLLFCLHDFPTVFSKTRDLNRAASDCLSTFGLTFMHIFQMIQTPSASGVYQYCFGIH